MAVLVAEGLVHRFAGDIESVLADVSLEVHSPEVVTIVGRSGCGKTTLLRILSGLLHPTAGAVSIDGRSPATALKERLLSFLWQGESLLPWLTALENVALALRVGTGRMATAAARQEATRVLEEVGLGNALDKLPSKLSGGMRQRVGLARALVTRPRILVLDEPFSSLDDLTRETLLLMVHRLTKSRGTACILATHNLADAAAISDRVLLIAGKPATISSELTFESLDGISQVDHVRAERAAKILSQLRKDLAS